MINSPNAFCVTALPCKILIAISVFFSLLRKRHYFIFAISLSIFIQISQFLKESYYWLSFLDVRNRHKVKRYAMKASETSM